MLTRIKKKVQEMLSWEAKAAHKIGLTPNIVTALGFVLSFLAAVAYAIVNQNQQYWLLVGVVLLMASGFCDTLDGILARTYKQDSAFGGFLDSLLDRYADSIVFAGIIISGLNIMSNSQVFIIIGLAALISSFMVSYARARAEATGIKMETIGIAERPERILILAGTSIAAFFWLPALTIGLAIIAVLATLTVIQRGLHVYKALKKDENKFK
jgi:archaetidylinositol phosphate synthase